MPVKVKRKTSLMSTYRATAKHLNEVVEKHAKGAATLASELAPRSNIDTPGYVHMADSITVKQEAPARWRVIVGKIYAIFVELGTVFMDAIPFFRPSVASGRRGLRRELKVVKGTPRIS